ncbi:3004_t:CDS:2, partial [Dentiscutata erythropus]
GRRKSLTTTTSSGNPSSIWFDNCEEESEVESMSDNQQKQNIGSYADAVKDAQNEVPAQSSNTSSLSNLTNNNNQKITKSSNDKLINSPTGEFVPIKSGKTNFSYGILHLYRDPKEIPSPNQENESTVKSKETDESMEDEFFNKDNTILAVLAVPSYLSASDFLGF